MDTIARRQLARMDFLLKAEEIVVEVKMARSGRDERKIGDELIGDVARYREHHGWGEVPQYA